MSIEEEKLENTQNSIDKDSFDTNNIKSILNSNHTEKNSRRSSISFGFLNGKNHTNADGSTHKRRKSISVILLGRKSNKVGEFRNSMRFVKH